MRNMDRYFWAAAIFFILAMLATYLGEEIIDEHWHQSLTVLRSFSLLTVVGITGWKGGFCRGLIVLGLLGVILMPHIIGEVNRGEWEREIPPYILLIIIGIPALWFISHVRRTATALQTSEGKYRTLIENTVDFIFMIDRGNRVVSVNTAAARLLGKTPEEVTGKTIFELFPEELARQYSNDLKRVFETRTFLVEESKLIAGERELWISASLSPVKNPSGEVIAVIGVSKDLTERREGENRLKESEELFSKAFHHSPLPMTIANFPERRLVDVNDSFLRLLEYSREETVGHTTAEINFFTDPETQVRMLLLFQKEGRMQNYETTMRTKTGKLLTVLFSCERIVIHGQDHVITMIIDITERKRTEEEIARLLGKETQAAREWRGTFDAVTDVVTLVSPDFELLRVNKAVYEATGRKPDDLLGRKCYEVFHGANAPIEECPCNKALKTKTACTSEITQQRKHYLLSAYPVFNNEGEITSFTHIVSDITERREAENRLKESEAFFSKAFHSSPIAMSIVSLPEKRIVDVNNNLLQMSEYTREEMIGHFTDELNLHANPEVRDQMMKVFSIEGRLRNFEFVRQTKTGRLLTVLFSCEKIVIRGQDHIITMTVDITDRKRAEEALLNANQRMNAFLESSPDGFCLLDAELNHVTLNQAALDMYPPGTRKEDIIGKNITELSPNVGETERCTMMQVIKTGKPLFEENTVTHPKFGERILNARVFKAGDHIGIITTDVTERKQAEEALLTISQRMNDFLESSPDGFCLFDEELNLITLNQAALDIYPPGTRKEDIIGKNIKELSPNVGEAERYAMMQVLKTGIPLFDENTVTHPKFGERILNAKVFKTANGLGVIITDITERKKALDLLEESEQKYHSLFEEMLNGFAYHKIIFDENNQPVDYVFLEVNNAFERLTGLKKKDIIGKRASEVIPGFKKANPRLLSRFIKVTLTGGETRDDYYYEPLAIWINASVYTPKKGYIVVIFENITERKTREKDLQESEQKYRSLFERMLNGYVYGRVILDERDQPVDLVCMDVNPAFEKITGLRREDVIGAKAREGTTGTRNLMPELLPLYRQVALTGGESHMDRYFKDLDLWLSLSVFSPMKDHFVIVFENITERKQQEKELQESEASLREAQRIAHMGNWEWDIINDRVKWSEEVFRILDLDPQKAMPCYKEFLSHIHPEDRELIQRFTQEALRGKNPYDMDYRILRTDGSERILHQKSELIKDDSGRLLRICGTVYDVTERRQMEEKLALTERLASVGEMASGIAHELNNPLTSILGFSELIMKHDIPDAVKEDLDIMNREARRASQITKNLLRFARKYTPRKEKTDIHSIIEAVLELRAHEHRVHSIEIVRCFSSGLPAIMADGFQLQQVFLNIVINAEYFMIETHKRGTLNITTKQTGDIVKISFADTGPGIAPHNLKHLFDPFFTTKEAGKGTGLGLSICYGTIKEHGGRLYAESEPGKGATFTIELPVNNGHHPDEIK